MMNENEEKLYEMAENELANEPRRRLVGQVPSLLLRGREPGERPIRSTASEGRGRTARRTPTAARRGAALAGAGGLRDGGQRRLRDGALKAEAAARSSGWRPRRSC